jgi:hypothetical protein
VAAWLRIWLTVIRGGKEAVNGAASRLQRFWQSSKAKEREIERDREREREREKEIEPLNGR